MKAKKSALKIVYKAAEPSKPKSAEDAKRSRASAKRNADQAQREKQEQAHKLTRDQVKLRVKEIRDYLEKMDNVLAATTFDILQPDMPNSLDQCDDKRSPCGLAARLIPMIDWHYERLEKYLYDHDEWDLVDGVLGPMGWALSDAAFAIGVLFGAIRTSAPRRDIDRLERGLSHAIAARHWEIEQR